MGESGQRSACGNRFGCVFCGMVSNDKSLENMMQEQEYSHLKPLNAFGNYLLAVQWDMSRARACRTNAERSGIHPHPGRYL
jgi:hypothetical protein